MDTNICTLSDSYKFGHWPMYPPGTTRNHAYLEAREGAKYSETVFVGLQPILKDHFVGPVVTQDKIQDAIQKSTAHFGFPAFNTDMYQHILDNLGGRLPLHIKAVPEGTPVPVGNVLMTVDNTDPRCAPLTNAMETILTHVWAPSTVATVSRHLKKLMTHYLDMTSDNPDAINFMLHDFGMRGVSSVESAGSSGMGHLVNFLGTDTFRACEYIMHYYGGSMPGFSVNATEHSIMTAEGRAGEMKVVKRLLEKYPTGILSIVIDSYDYRNFIREVATLFGDQIKARDGKVVFRPDSGDPVETTMEVMVELNTAFGCTKNSKGFKTLSPQVGMLWGDGVGPDGIESILKALFQHGWDAQNIVFGMGGGLLQKVNRDTQRFAFKSSYQERDGVGYDIFKDPIDGSKKSKAGRLMLIKTQTGVKTIRVEDEYQYPECTDMLETVFLNGDLTRDMTFAEVRENAKL